MNAPAAARDDARLAATAAADHLARDADVADLAAGIVRNAGRGFPAALMAHELALNHRLVMRFGAMADEFLDFTKPSADPGERQIGREAARFAAIAARLAERVRQAALAFRGLKADGARRGKPAAPPRLCAGCLNKQAKAAGPAAPARSPRDLAAAELAGLAGLAGLAELADGAALGAGQDLAAILMAHELALNHRLAMRFGAAAGRFLGYTSATIDPDRRQVGRDALGLAAIAARLGERVGKSAKSLSDLARLDDARGKTADGRPRLSFGCAKCGLICNARTGRFLFEYLEKGYRADRTDSDPDGSGPAGPRDPDDRGGGPEGDGSGGGGSAPPAGSTAPPAANGTGGPTLASPAGHGVDRSDSMSRGKPAARRGRLNNGNPPGDFLAAPRCGARTRDQGCCRQPAMKNGRCRLHGGKSTGPRTAQGLSNSRRARLIHGRRTAALIQLRSAAFHHGRRLADLTRLARQHTTSRRGGPWAQSANGRLSPMCPPAGADDGAPTWGRPSNSPAARSFAAGHGVDRSERSLPPGATIPEHILCTPRLLM